MYGYIYLTENLINGRCYIGQHKSTEVDNDYFGSGIALQNALKHYGKDNFVSTIIEWCESKQDLDDREVFWIKHCNAVEDNLFYNVAYGGQGGAFLTGKAEEIRQQNLRKATSSPEFSKKIIEKNINFWSKLTKEERDAIGNKISKGHRNRSEEEKLFTSLKHSNTLKNMSDEKKKHKSESIKASLANRSDEEKKLQHLRYSQTIANQSEEERERRRKNISDGVKRALQKKKENNTNGRI